MQISGAPQFVRSRSVLTLGVVTALSVTLLAGSLVAWRYGEVIEKVEEDLTNVSNLLSAHSTEAFQGVDVIQNQVIDRLKENGASSPDELRATVPTRELNEELKRTARSIDILDALSIVDDKGRVLNFSRGWPIPQVNVADRDYFRTLSAPGSGPDHWSAPVRNRGNGVWTIFHAKRLEGPDGVFVGLVLAMVSVEKLERHYASIALTPGSTIALLRTDGALLVRNPSARPESETDSSVTTEPSIARVARRVDRAVFDDTDAAGESRVTAISKLPDYPLLIAASSPRRAVLASWLREAIVIGVLALILDLTIAIASLLASRQLRARDEALLAAQHAASHDVLTGLPNRSYFKDRLDEVFGDEHGAATFALLLIDLDRFKEINDSLGHAAGDELLMAVSRRLRQAIGPADFLARLGGDEFAVLHRGDVELEEQVLAERLLNSLSTPIALSDSEIRISCSIGVAVAHEDAEDGPQLLAHADLALFRAKEAGRNDVRAYAVDMGVERKERLLLLRDLRGALERGQLKTFFQPIVSLEKRRIVAFEALMRWRDPRRGFVSPADFIPLAEESGLIARIGAWVLDEACRQARLWPDDVKVAVNLSPVQLRMQDMFAQTCATLAASGLPANRLMLEITESVQLEQTHAGQTLRKLRELGVGVSLDDFGTGYASLSYLQSFPFDLIKIDQSFIRQMGRSPECRVIVETVLLMAERLGMAVTAEGVETFEQLETLQRLKCRKVQGYLFGVPMPARAVPGFLADWRFPYPPQEPTLALAG